MASPFAPSSSGAAHNLGLPSHLPPQQQHMFSHQMAQQQQQQQQLAAISSPRIPYTRIAELKPMMKNITVRAIVLDKGEPQRTKDSVISHNMIADESGCVSFSMWDGIGEQIRPGDIIRLTGSWTNLFQGKLVLYSGRTSTIDRIGEFFMLFNESSNMSNLEWTEEPPNSKNFIARKVAALPPQHPGMPRPQQIPPQQSQFGK